jgi:hypothetical protein
MSATLNIVTEPIQNIVAVTQPVATIEAAVQEPTQPPTLEEDLGAKSGSWTSDHETPFDQYATGSVAAFSSVTAGTSYTRSSSFWLRDFDWTGVSPWNSTGGRERGGTAISPRHIAFANHFAISNGATIHFVTDINTVVSRTLVNQTRIGTTDIQIGALNSDLPASVKFYKILPDYLSASLNDVFKLAFAWDKDQNVEARLQTTGGMLTTIPSGPLASFSGSVVVGDSGQPAFWILKGEPIFLGSYSSLVGFDPVVSHASAIDAAMTSLGGGYSTTAYDISASYPFYGDF